MNSKNPNSKPRNAVAIQLCLVSVGLSALAIVNLGCRVQPPGGSPIQPGLLGSVVDEANRIQEENAEAAKFIVYMHEFEANTPNHAELLQIKPAISGEFEYQTEDRVQGFRLNPAGQDHVRQIARHLISTQSQEDDREYVPHRFVIIERNDTSKHWRSVHRFPVHYNDELDAARRQVVVNALTILGVYDAEQIVVVAPAFPEGLNASEASQAYSRGFNYGGGQSGGGNSGGRGRSGGGGGGFGG